MILKFSFAELHCKKLPVAFPAPSQDVTEQTLSSREYVSLMKPGIFPDIPFPSQEFSQNPFKSVSVPIHRQEFSGIFLCSAGNSSKIFDNLSVYLFPARSFHGFPWIFLIHQTGIITTAFGQPSPI
jgi:hypothetical protein